ncbi:ficolin-2-like [Procambarus clarkii]|uniref:ficolin-2-like n=1 Tax=Procambarus clarkii TaxID=6728 RepID=UPI003742D2DC
MLSVEGILYIIYTHICTGLAALHALTHHANTTLRAHLLDHRLHHAHAAYTVFSVGGPEDQYRLHVDGYDPSSTAGDALSPHSRAIFTSPEPSSGDRCSDDLDAGWWFIEAPDCHLTLPTGRYQHHPDEYQRTGGVEWRPWRGSGYSLHTLLLMIRRGP